MKDTLFWLLVQNEEEGKNKRYEKKTKNNCAFVERWSMFHMYTSFSVYHKLHIDWILHLWCLLLCCWDHNVEQLEGPVNNYFWHCKTFDSFWPTAKLSSRSPSKGFQKLFFFFFKLLALTCKNSVKPKLLTAETQADSSTAFLLYL